VIDLHRSPTAPGPAHRPEQRPPPHLWAGLHPPQRHRDLDTPAGLVV